MPKAKTNQKVKEIDEKTDNIQDVVPDETEKKTLDDPLLPNKSLLRKDEVARYFQISDQTVYLWGVHGILEEVRVGGVIRYSRDSVLECRFNKKAPSKKKK